jgi:nucleotide-binding universal stress UspA family protein
MKILIPVHGMEHTRRAITYFLQNRAFFDLKAKIVLMHARQELPRIAIAALSAEALAEHMKTELDKDMGWARERFEQSRIPFEEVIVTGDPAEKIVELARSGQYDLIVMGSHVDEPTRRLLRGSVTFQVLSSCKVPVLVIR